MDGLVADTHAVLWYLAGSPRLSHTAHCALDEALANGHRIYVSAISVVEVLYLWEKGRIPHEALDLLNGALSAPVAGLAVVPLDATVAAAVGRIPRTEVPEMPDRIIAATALHLSLPLVTRDLRIRATSLTTIW